MNEKGAWSESQEITKESVNIKAKEKSRERERESKGSLCHQMIHQLHEKGKRLIDRAIEIDIQ